MQWAQGTFIHKHNKGPIEIVNKDTNAKRYEDSIKINMI